MSAGKGHICQLHPEEAEPEIQSTWRERSPSTSGESSTQLQHRTCPTNEVHVHHQQSSQANCLGLNYSF